MISDSPNTNTDSTVSSNNDERSSSDSESWKQSESTEQTPDDDSTSMINFPLDTSEGRSLPNVLKRISNIVALKSNVGSNALVIITFLLHVIILYILFCKISTALINILCISFCRIYVRTKILN